MHCTFEMNFNRAQQQIKMNTFFLIKSTEILTTINVQWHIKAKRRHFSLLLQTVHFCRGMSNIILSLQQHGIHVLGVQQDKNHCKK